MKLRCVDCIFSICLQNSRIIQATQTHGRKIEPIESGGRDSPRINRGSKRVNAVPFRSSLRASQRTNGPPADFRLSKAPQAERAGTHARSLVDKNCICIISSIGTADSFIHSRRWADGMPRRRLSACARRRLSILLRRLAFDGVLAQSDSLNSLVLADFFWLFPRAFFSLFFLLLSPRLA